MALKLAVSFLIAVAVILFLSLRQKDWFFQTRAVLTYVLLALSALIVALTPVEMWSSKVTKILAVSFNVTMLVLTLIYVRYMMRNHRVNDHNERMARVHN